MKEKNIQVMIETLKDKLTKARKGHRCNYCNGIIKKGELYSNTSVVNDGDVYNWKSHLHCYFLAGIQSLFGWTDYNCDGITLEDFEATLEDYYYDHKDEFPDYDKCPPANELARILADKFGYKLDDELKTFNEKGYR